MRHLLAILFLGLVGAAGLAAQAPAEAPPAAPEERVADGGAVGRRVAARAGEICASCNTPIGEHDAVYQVHGQRVPVHLNGVCDANLRARPGAIVAQLRPRGAFLGAVSEAPQLSAAWFLVGLYVLTGLLFAAVCAHRALHAGQSPVRWFFAGLVFNAPGYLALLTRPKRPVAAPAGIPRGLGKISSTYAPEVCACGAENHPAAKVCSGCGGTLAPRAESEAARVGLAG